MLYEIDKTSNDALESDKKKFTNKYFFEFFIDRTELEKDGISIDDYCALNIQYCNEYMYLRNGLFIFEQHYINYDIADNVEYQIIEYLTL